MSRTRRLFRGAVASFAGVLMLSALSLVADITPAEASGPASGAVYVALGDSYSAGEGLGNWESGTDVVKGTKQNTCHRSASHAYADLSPAVVLPSVTNRGFWACSGATVTDMENTPGSAGTPKEYRESSQVSRVDSTTQYMTLTVGGDDLHFSDIGHACAEYSLFSKTGYIGAKVSCAKEISNQETHMLSLESDLEGLYAQLLSAAAPGAELVVAGYPKILPSTYPKNLTRLHGTPFCTFDHLHGIGSIGMPVPDAKRVAKFISDLNHAIQDAVSSASQAYPGQVMYADVYPTSIPRNCKGTTPNATVAGIELSPRGTGIGPGGLISTATFHPTKAGQAVYAKAVQATFDAFTTSRGAIAFDDSAGTAPPPSDLGGHSLTPLSEWFGNEGDYINELDGPTGSLDFSGYGAIAQIGSGWATWSQDYGGDVLEFGDFGADSSVTITLPPGTTAFYLYAEPDEFATYDMVASANNGTTSGDETVYGDSGASFFGFYTTRPGVAIESVSISTSDDFAIGEFGISNQ